ncbi:MAG TPA: lipopolysaccharide biosynthesis protein [Chthoniobacterales bacterium]|jgi:PST family polysaccharide transporter
MEARRHVARGVTWSAAESIAGQTISFLLFLVLARLLAPADFGVVAVANLCVMVIQSFIFLGMGQAIVQFSDLDEQHLDTVFYINLFSGLFFFVLTITASSILGQWFQTPLLASVLCWLSPVFLIAGLTDVQNNLLVREMNFRALALRTLLSYVAGGIVGVVMAVKGAGVWSLVGQQLTTAFMNLVVLWTASRWRPGLKFSSSRAKVLSRFGMHMMWVDLVGMVNRRADQFVVGKFIGPVQVGFYAVGARVSMLITEVMSKSVARVTLSALSRLQDDMVRFRSVLLEMTEMQTAVVFPTAIGLALVAPEVMQIFFGSKWAASVPVMQALVLACPFEALSGAHQSALVAKGKPQLSSILTSVHAVLNVIAVALAVHWGTTAVAAAFLIRALIMYPVELIVLHKAIDLPVGQVLRLLIPQVVASAVMAAIVALVQRALSVDTPILLRLVLAIASGAAVYMVVLFILNPTLLKRMRRQVSTPPATRTETNLL